MFLSLTILIQSQPSPAESGQEDKMKKKTVFIVMTDDESRTGCPCSNKKVDSVWFNEKKANERSAEVYLGIVISMKIEDSQFISLS